jgi:hypothetical protein
MIRPATIADLPLVRSSWLTSYSSSEWALLNTPKDSEHTRSCPTCEATNLRSHRVRGLRVYHAGDEYWSTQKRLIERLIASCNVSVFVVDEPMVDGWIVRDWRSPIVDYVYTRNSAREPGADVARKLVADLAAAPAVTYTHKSRGVDEGRLPKGWTFSKAQAFRFGAG